MPSFRTLDDLDVAGKRVFLRVDLNVPLKDGVVTDATRIERVAPTIRELLDRKAIVIVGSHLGRPKGKRSDEFSLKPLVAALSAALGGTSVRFAEDCVGPAARELAGSLAEGEVGLLENLRFEPGEEANDAEFAKSLASLADYYVDDAFSCAHRAHASIDAIARLLPSAAGRLLEFELSSLERALVSPHHPVVAIVGGNKISTKLTVLENLLDKVDHLVIGGAMANTFLHAQGVEVGASLHEADMADTARDVLKAAEAKNCDVVLPVDGVVAAALETGAATQTVAIDAIPSNQMVLDIGPASVAALTDLLAGCRTLVWNGPLGAFEFPPFDKGTVAVAQAAAGFTDGGNLLSVAGGGDTVAALAAADVVDRFSYISTAGGAFLEWLEGKTLPGVAVLTAE